MAAGRRSRRAARPGDAPTTPRCSRSSGSSSWWWTRPAKIQLMVETKHPTRYAGLVERRLVEMLRRFGLDGWVPIEEAQVTVMSFSEVALRRVRRLAPGVPLVMLMERVPVAYRSGMLPKGVRVAGPGLRGRPGTSALCAPGAGRRITGLRLDRRRSGRRRAGLVPWASMRSSRTGRARCGCRSTS